MIPFTRILEELPTIEMQSSPEMKCIPEISVRFKSGRSVEERT